MGFFDFLKGKGEAQAPAPAAPKAKAAKSEKAAPERSAESLQAEQMRLLRAIGILNGERLATLDAARIKRDLQAIDRVRGLAEKESALAKDAAEAKRLEQWKKGLSLLSGMYRAQVKQNHGKGPGAKPRLVKAKLPPAKGADRE